MLDDASARRAVRYMYVRAGSSTADRTDSYVQAAAKGRSAPKPAGRSTLAAGVPSVGNDCARTTQPNLRRPRDA
jgi:hypothetical protein